VMAVSVNRQIERDLLIVLGQPDPVGMIRARSSGTHQGLRLSAAPTGRTHDRKWPLHALTPKPLPAGGHPHMTITQSPNHLSADNSPRYVSQLIPAEQAANLRQVERIDITVKPDLDQCRGERGK
jgi:hypothetical protein